MPSSRADACRLISSFLSPGCVINSVWHPKWPPNIEQVASAVIQWFQARYFGRLGFNKSTHTRIWLPQSFPSLDQEMRELLTEIDGHEDWAARLTPNYFQMPEIFEVTTPRAQYTSLWNICLDHLRILKYTPRELTQADVDLLRSYADELLGKEYNYKRLINFLIWQQLGYPPVSIGKFSWARKRTVCSVGIAALMQRLRKHYAGQSWMPRLFSKINGDTWKKAGRFRNIADSIIGYTNVRDISLEPGYPEHVDVTYLIRTFIEHVTPAHFDNAEKYFNGEYELVAEFRNGKKVA